MPSRSGRSACPAKRSPVRPAATPGTPPMTRCWPRRARRAWSSLRSISSRRARACAAGEPAPSGDGDRNMTGRPRRRFPPESQGIFRLFRNGRVPRRRSAGREHRWRRMRPFRCRAAVRHRPAGRRRQGRPWPRPACKTFRPEPKNLRTSGLPCCRTGARLVITPAGRAFGCACGQASAAAAE